jgi:hypothetical protein
MARGTLVGESLRLGAALDDVTMVVTRVARVDAGDESAGQPRFWTLSDFEVADHDADRFAEKLRDALDPGAGWYCDFRTADETYVVFAGRIFRYPRGDARARTEAAAYATSVGVPGPQLDWPE